MDHIALAKLSFKKNREMITHSEIIESDGTARIKVYFEKINDAGDDFDCMTVLYPDIKVIENNGYSEQEISQRIDEFRRWGELAMAAEMERIEERCPA